MGRLIGKHLLVVLSLLLSRDHVGAVDNGLAITPQMGWVSCIAFIT